MGLLVIFKLKTRDRAGWHGLNRFTIDFHFESPNPAVRDRIWTAIEKALADPPPVKDQKPSSIGFQQHGPEDE